MKYKIKQETKPTLTTFGKYKAVAVHGGTVDTRQIIDEVCENNPISEGAVIAVMMRLSEVVRRHLRRGDKVRLDDWGLMTRWTARRISAPGSTSAACACTSCPRAARASPSCIRTWRLSVSGRFSVE